MSAVGCLRQKRRRVVATSSYRRDDVLDRKLKSCTSTQLQAFDSIVYAIIISNHPKKIVSWYSQKIDLLTESLCFLSCKSNKKNKNKHKTKGFSIRCAVTRFIKENIKTNIEYRNPFLQGLPFQRLQPNLKLRLRKRFLCLEINYVMFKSGLNILERKCMFYRKKTLKPKKSIFLD